MPSIGSESERQDLESASRGQGASFRPNEPLPVNVLPNPSNSAGNSNRRGSQPINAEQSSILGQNEAQPEIERATEVIGLPENNLIPQNLNAPDPQILHAQTAVDNNATPNQRIENSAVQTEVHNGGLQNSQVEMPTGVLENNSLALIPTMSNAPTSIGFQSEPPNISPSVSNPPPQHTTLHAEIPQMTDGEDYLNPSPGQPPRRKNPLGTIVSVKEDEDKAEEGSKRDGN